MLEKGETLPRLPEFGRDLILSYPSVYIVRQKSERRMEDPRPLTKVYVGETTSIAKRTSDHLSIDPKNRADWRIIAEEAKRGLVDMFVIGHPHFNKSLTLDIEDRLMTYMLGSPEVDVVYNRRPNPQSDYYTKDEIDAVFKSIWKRLRAIDKDQFPAEEVIRNSAIFKASPFHTLTPEQIRAKNEIVSAVQDLLLEGSTGNLILIEGEAGAGKTVLLSTLFYELCELLDDDADDAPAAMDDEGKEEGDRTPLRRGVKAHLVVNHEEQLVVYQRICEKLLIPNPKADATVAKPTTFLNQRAKNGPADVVLVDEAHLLWTQGKQSYRGKNQLEDLIANAKIVIAVMDQHQVLRTNQYWEAKRLEWLDSVTTRTVGLHNQMRINADPETVDWIRDFVDLGVIRALGEDEKGYDLRVFEDPEELFQQIRKKALDRPETDGLARMIASYDWEYSSKMPPASGTYWTVDIDGFSLPWNRELARHHSEATSRKPMSDRLPWAEQPDTLNEVGSIYTIQGFDLNYAGVIIGPSVAWEDGRVVFHPERSRNKDAKQRRTMSDGSKVRIGEELIRNELNVLLTRGVRGLYIYAVDEGLRAALLAARRGENPHGR